LLDVGDVLGEEDVAQELDLDIVQSAKVDGRPVEASGRKIKHAKVGHRQHLIVDVLAEYNRRVRRAIAHHRVESGSIVNTTASVRHAA
jgi:hypothetical protein